MNTCIDTYINKYIHTYINTYINAYIKWHDMTLQFITWAYQTRQTDRQTHTHTCSETSYRITDVECIVRAKNTPVNLTGDGEWPGVRNSVEEFCRWNCNNVVDSVFNS